MTMKVENEGGIIMVKIIVSREPGGLFSTPTKHTGLSQRDSLETIISNLGDHMGIRKVYKKYGARGGTFYCPDNKRGVYQSTTNTILGLSAKLSLSRG